MCVTEEQGPDVSGKQHAGITHTHTHTHTHIYMDGRRRSFEKITRANTHAHTYITVHNTHSATQVQLNNLLICCFENVNDATDTK